MKKKFFVTAAIPYVNAAPHIGHALEFVQVDALKRFHQLLGEDSISLSGGDENALKNVQAAEKANENVKPFVDRNNTLFQELVKNLNCDFDIWQKGSDQERHFKSSQKLWELCLENGDIYQKEYKGLYCIGCEAFYTIDELDNNGECFEHPGKKLEEISENNYFFKLSKYQQQLISLVKSDKLKIFPEERKNEVLSFLNEPLQDISISRSNERAKNWGVPVPNDPSQKLYVWFDALNIYQTGVGFGWDEEKYNKYWPADVHVIGKGITRFHAVYWPAFLLSARLKLPKSIFVHGYFTVNGQKMSKTLGNVIDPNILISKYGADALRYYLLAKFSPFTDGDFSEDKLKEVYNGELANGLGNLVSRVAKMCERSGFEFESQETNIYKEVEGFVNEFRFDYALKFIWEKVSLVDQEISSEQTWTLKGSKLKNSLQKHLTAIAEIALNLKPFLPETTSQIAKIFGGPVIKSNQPMFPRIQ